MIARVTKAMQEKDKGFTLIELLVVVIIIGILAAIAIPVFLNQRKSAVDAGVKSDIRTIANEIETYYTNNQEYPATADVTATGGTYTITGGNTGPLSHDQTTVTYAKDAGTDAFTLEGSNSSAGTGDTFVYDSDAGGLQATPKAAS